MNILPLVTILLTLGAAGKQFGYVPVTRVSAEIRVVKNRKPELVRSWYAAYHMHKIPMFLNVDRDLFFH